MKKVKTRELTGLALDWAVELAKGTHWSGNSYFIFPNEGVGRKPRHDYSTDWSQGGPILEREGIDTINAKNVGHDHNWMAAWPTRFGSRSDFYFGDTKLIAGMRCYVASKLGEEVEVPEDML